MSKLEKFVKLEMIKDVPLKYIVDLMDNLEKENADLKKRNSNMNHGMARDLQKIANLEKENAELKDQLEQSEVDRKSATLQCESMRKDQNTLSAVEKENKRLRENWENLEKWVKGKKINFTGDDRFWRGYDDFHGDVRAKMEKLEKGGE